jgi:exodeoxyribonuclease X
MATHHIIGEDLEGEDHFPADWTPPWPVSYIVGHNVDYDWKAIGEPPVKRICTLALARKVWPLLDSHKLAALIYHTNLHRVARSLLTDAHSATTDVRLTQRLLDDLLPLIGEPQTWEELWQISEQARTPTRMAFGKYGPDKYPPAGKLISEVLREDRNYVSWLLSGKCDQVEEDPYLARALGRK